MFNKQTFILAALVLGVLTFNFTSALAKHVSTTQPVGSGSLTVTVLDPDGKAAAGAVVRLFAHVKKGEAGKSDAGKSESGKSDSGASEGGKKHPTPIAVGHTDANGVVTFSDLPEGKYMVQANLKGVGHGHEKAKVTDGNSAVTITLEEGKHGHKSDDKGSSNDKGSSKGGSND